MRYEVKKTGYEVKKTGYKVKKTGYKVKKTGYKVKKTGYKVKKTGYKVKIHWKFKQRPCMIEFKPRRSSAKKRFFLSADSNLETLSTISSGTNYV